MSYTKGEWKVERVPIDSMGGSNTCFKIGTFQACIYDDWRQYDERGITTEEIEANAKLIAAAPKLAEAIQYYFDVLEEVRGKSWDKNPDHVLQKMLIAMTEAGLLTT